MNGGDIMPMNDAEYGRHIREQSRKYWLRYKAIQSLKDRELERIKFVVTETMIADEIKKQSK